MQTSQQLACLFAAAFLLQLSAEQLRICFQCNRLIIVANGIFLPGEVFDSKELSTRYALQNSLPWQVCEHGRAPYCVETECAASQAFKVTFFPAQIQFGLPVDAHRFMKLWYRNRSHFRYDMQLLSNGPEAKRSDGENIDLFESLKEPGQFHHLSTDIWRGAPDGAGVVRSDPQVRGRELVLEHFASPC